MSRFLRTASSSRIATWLVVAAIALASSAGLAQSKEHEALLQLEHDTAKAWLAGDAKFIDALEATEYVFTGPDGAITGKTDDVEGMKSGALKFTQFALDDMKVMVFDQAAVVTGRITLKGNYGKVVYDGPYRFTDVFIWRDGRWQLVASQNTAIPRS